MFREKSLYDSLSQAVIRGRFDKDDFKLSNSLIVGEDGGLYLLLNRLDQEQQQGMVQKNIVTEIYLKDKIVKAEEEKGDKIRENFRGDKIVLGKGGFGKVRLALNLFRGKKDPGDIVCIKKTKNFKELTPKGTDISISNALQQATEITLKDYFASGVAEKVYAPQIFDLALVADPLVNSEDKLNKCHQKGYLMMEMFPQNTATKIFREPTYQKWKYQKPFLIDLISGTLELLNKRIAFTDLKPDNALFDPDTFKTTIIDLGGTIKIAATDSVDNFNIRSYSCQFTSGYRAPETVKSINTSISLPKALAYTCGKVIEEVVQKSDYSEKDLKQLIDSLIKEIPQERMTLEEALAHLKKWEMILTEKRIY